MTGLTEMCVSPTEPLCDTATELAFELDKISPVLLTILDSASYTYRRALSTDEFFFLEVLVVVLACFTVFHSTKVGV